MVDFVHKFKEKVTNGCMNGIVIDCDVGLRGTGNEHELYTVKWENGKIEKGIFWNDIWSVKKLKKRRKQCKQ